ncbi:MAG: hypothetical protein KME52_28890 [Desmonostoc geniculatum HA4340-LM1]|nr:hypothetical protein [Desmonostoc geniculatum HA4340-LM1]
MEDDPEFFSNGYQFTRFGDKDYTKLGGLGIALAYAFVKTILTGHHSSHGEIGVIKSFSKSYEAYAKGVKPLQEHFKMLHESQHANVLAKLKKGHRALNDAMHPDLADESFAPDREFILQSAWETFDELDAMLRHVPHLSAIRVAAIKHSALTHLALGHVETAKKRFGEALKVSEFMANMPSIPYGSMEQYLLDNYDKSSRILPVTLFKLGATLVCAESTGEKYRKNHQIMHIKEDGRTERIHLERMLAEL